MSVNCSTKIESIDPMQKEDGFSAKKYFAIALVIGGIAAGIFSYCLPASIVFATVATWCIGSAILVLANRVVKEGSCLAKPIHRWHAVAVEVNSLAASAALFPLTFWNSYHRPQGNPQGRPILMVNGYLSFGSTWSYQRQKLVQAGFGPVYTMNVGSGRSIQTYAEQVRKKVQQIQKDLNRKDLILIAHSKGGLVSSYFATALADSTMQVTDIITIGTPFEGTPIAAIGFGEDAREMEPGSAFLLDLQQRIREKSNICFFQIASEVDEIVPLESARWKENPSRQLVLKDLGHLGLLFSSRVANQIHQWLLSRSENG